MPDEPDAQGTGPQSSQGDDSSSQGGQEPPADSQQGDGAADSQSTPSSRSQQVVTPDILKGVLEAQARTYQGHVEKAVAAFQDQVSTLSKAVESAKAPKSDSSSKKKGEPHLDDPELVELREKVKSLEDSSSKAVQEAERARQQERDYRFRTTVMDALVRAECSKPEAAFHVIRDSLKIDEDGRIYSTVDGEFGAREMDLDPYVSQHVKQNVIPELFAGQMRPGSGATGDQGSADGKHLFDLTKLQNNPEFWEKNIDKVRTAFEQKRVNLEG